MFFYAIKNLDKSNNINKRQHPLYPPPPVLLTCITYRKYELTNNTNFDTELIIFALFKLVPPNIVIVFAIFVSLLFATLLSIGHLWQTRQFFAHTIQYTQYNNKVNICFILCEILLQVHNSETNFFCDAHNTHN